VCEQHRRRSVSESTAPTHRQRPRGVGAMPDTELLEPIRREIRESPFVGEGHKRLTARLRLRGICTSRKRVLRLMREHGRLAPDRRRSVAARGGCTTAASRPTRRTSCGRPTRRGLRRATTAAARCVRSSITTPGEAWVDGVPRIDHWAAADLLREASLDRFGSVEAAPPPASSCATTAEHFDNSTSSSAPAFVPAPSSTTGLAARTPRLPHPCQARAALTTLDPAVA
jgi:hypothetical protein